MTPHQQKIIQENSFCLEDDRCVTRPDISVLMWVYNQVDYVHHAVSSVMMQQTNYSYELVISDDCSSDGTTEILKGYQAKYPEKIRLILSRRNLWQEGVIQDRLWRAAKGQYIALHHGDDYWDDPLKLQKQVDLLEAHPDYSMCFHSVYEQRENSTTVYRPPYDRSCYTVHDLLRQNFARTCSVMYRRCHLEAEDYAWLAELPAGDWGLTILHATRGNVGYIDEPMATYRVHTGGVWNSEKKVKNLHKSIDIAKAFMAHFPVSVHQCVPEQAIADFRREIVAYCLVWGNQPFAGYRDLLWLLIRGQCPVFEKKHLWRLLFWCLLPWFTYCIGGVRKVRMLGKRENG